MIHPDPEKIAQLHALSEQADVVAHRKYPDDPRACVTYAVGYFLRLVGEARPSDSWTDPEVRKLNLHVSEGWQDADTYIREAP